MSLILPKTSEKQTFNPSLGHRPCLLLCQASCEVHLHFSPAIARQYLSDLLELINTRTNSPAACMSPLCPEQTRWLGEDFWQPACELCPRSALSGFHGLSNRRASPVLKYSCFNSRNTMDKSHLTEGSTPHLLAKANIQGLTIQGEILPPNVIELHIQIDCLLQDDV